MQAPHRYPVGVQVFEDVRTQGYVYADKTRYIWDMVHSGGKYRFLSRPRRFGKTLLVSTLEAYFQGRRELFHGLAIDGLEREWKSHPVLRFDLSSVKSTSIEVPELEGVRARSTAFDAPTEAMGDPIAFMLPERIPHHQGV